ncbi:hypothetical protein SAMN02745164_00589 [Marinitoga hydrogenitolerans DSM 16785]|uniref:Uncharacterized protein n=1 Tax=Marinitoga hydrogenitolerans (strain DSM 16785 / JCM 12826 / AT1271) TaxID=1122195 RepID=A0A1M4U6A9_MARH1|nr:hypothetical protein [Marinitoga hydrogenitolerans]SHE52150.1 hypothetical protein SAMN02745164_00589 [Marinitoga hydrogenitolerans DSM 16785]
MEITIQASTIIINFEKTEYEDSIENFSSLITEIFKNYFKRQIYLIANNCKIIDESGKPVNSAFFTWSKNLKIQLIKNDIELEYPVNLPIGQSLKSVPDRWIKVSFSGYTGDATLNGKKIELKKILELPPNQYTLETPYEKISFDLKNIYNKYNISLMDEIIKQEIEFKKILAIFDLETGIEITGEEKSIWIPKDGGEVLIVENAVFVSPFGLLEKKKGIQFHGIPVFAYENNFTIYLITSYGEIITLGLRNIIRDMERAPVSINVNNNKIYIITFGGKKYTIDLKTGGLYYTGQTTEIKNNIHIYTEKNFSLKNTNIFIKNNKVKITKKTTK